MSDTSDTSDTSPPTPERLQRDETAVRARMDDLRGLRVTADAAVDHLAQTGILMIGEEYRLDARSLQEAIQAIRDIAGALTDLERALQLLAADVRVMAAADTAALEDVRATAERLASDLPTRAQEIRRGYDAALAAGDTQEAARLANEAAAFQQYAQTLSAQTKARQVEVKAVRAAADALCTHYAAMVNEARAAIAETRAWQATSRARVADLRARVAPTEG